MRVYWRGEKRPAETDLFPWQSVWASNTWTVPEAPGPAVPRLLSEDERRPSRSAYLVPDTVSIASRTSIRDPACRVISPGLPPRMFGSLS